MGELCLAKSLTVNAKNRAFSTKSYQNPERRDNMPETDFSPELAVRLSKIAHNLCNDVPHDIGITLAQEVTRFYAEEPGEE